MLADAVSLLEQGVPDAGPAVGFTRLLMDHSNRREQGAGGAPTGDSQAANARRNSPQARRPGRGTAAAMVVLLDRAVSQSDSLAKNAAARVKKSCSFRSVSFSRVCRVRASCSARTVWRGRPWESTSCGSLLLRYLTVSEMPSSSATWATGRPDSRVSRTASDLKASVN